MSQHLFKSKFDLFEALLVARSEASRLISVGVKPYLIVDDYLQCLKCFQGQLSPSLDYDNSNLQSALLKLIDPSHLCHGLVILTLHDALSHLTNLDPLSKKAVIYCVEHAQDGLPIIKFCLNSSIKFLPVGGPATGGYVYDDKICRETIEDEFIFQKIHGFCYVEPNDFVNLAQALKYTNHIPGDVVEVGVFRGSSGSFMLEYSRRADLKPKTFNFFDAWDQFKYPEATKSVDAIWANTHSTEDVSIISNRLTSRAGNNNVTVRKLNIISDNIPSTIHSVSLANIDVDLYEAVLFALFKLAPLMSIGGIMICEDAGHSPMLVGARYALEQFITSEYANKFTVVHMSSSQVFLIKYSD
jgi:hypothetical protein